MGGGEGEEERGRGGGREREGASQDIFENRLDILCNSIYETDEINRSRANGTRPGMRQTLGKWTALLRPILQVQVRWIGSMLPTGLSSLTMTKEW